MLRVCFNIDRAVCFVSYPDPVKVSAGVDRWRVQRSRAVGGKNQLAGNGVSGAFEMFRMAKVKAFALGLEMKLLCADAKSAIASKLTSILQQYEFRNTDFFSSESQVGVKAAVCLSKSPTALNREMATAIQVRELAAGMSVKIQRSSYRKILASHREHFVQSSILQIHISVKGRLAIECAPASSDAMSMQLARSVD